MCLAISCSKFEPFSDKFRRHCFGNSVKLPPVLRSLTIPVMNVINASDLRSVLKRLAARPWRVYVMSQSFHVGNIHLSVKLICEYLRVVNDATSEEQRNVRINGGIPSTLRLIPTPTPTRIPDPLLQRPLNIGSPFLLRFSLNLHCLGFSLKQWLDEFQT